MTKHIHKLPFGVLQDVRAYERSALEKIVTAFYCEEKRDERSVVGYKDGHLEKDLLARLHIPSVNLECFGCPKVGELIDRMIWVETCGNHTMCDAYLHCPKGGGRDCSVDGEIGVKTNKNGSFKNHQK